MSQPFKHSQASHTAIDEYATPPASPAVKVEYTPTQHSPTLEAVLAETRSTMEEARRALANRPTAWQPRTWADLEAFAKRAAHSSMVPRDYQGKENDIILAVQMGGELGLAPMQALQNIACINGRPSVWGDAIPGLVYASGKCVYIREWFEGEGEALTAFCATLRRGEAEPGVQSYSVADAKQAGLWQTEARIKRHRRDGSGSFEVDNDSPWWRFPRRMLQNRARIVLRDKYPDVLKGLISAEEAFDMPPPQTLEPVVGKPKAPEAAQPPKPPDSPPTPAPKPQPEPPAPPAKTEQSKGSIEVRVAAAIAAIDKIDTSERLAKVQKKTDALIREAPDWAVDQLNTALFAAEQRIAGAADDSDEYDGSNNPPPPEGAR